VCLCQPGHWLGSVTGVGWSGPARIVQAGSDPAQKIKNKKDEAQPAQSVLDQRCIWQNTHLCLILFIPPLFILLSSQAFLDIKKFRKYLWTFLNLFVSPLYFF
jgi:hypothetical protein